MGKPIAGTYTYVVCHKGYYGTSDPVPHDATAEESHKAFLQACERAEALANKPEFPWIVRKWDQFVEWVMHRVLPS